ncbi:MAG: L,D-transpeptidase [Elusimicrobiota bacterium]|jgi:hypothetical protein
MDLLDRLTRRASPGLLLALALVLFVGAHAARLGLRRSTLACQERVETLALQRDESAEAASDFQALSELKGQDVAALKKGLAQLAKSKREIYEAGLNLQEEKRLLEKQLEMLTTYLVVDLGTGKIHRMRGEESLESFPLGAVRATGAEVKTPPERVQVVSKERFASPERGRFIETGGKLEWEPPQVGESPRANALGEFVMYAGGTFFLHGPPAKPADHEAFPHYCLGLSKAAARRLYLGSVIGTKLVFKNPAPAAATTPRR